MIKTLMKVIGEVITWGVIACRTLFTSNGFKMDNLVENWNDDLNLRMGGATRGKRSMFVREGRGVVYGYSRLQGSSPRLCRLKTVHSGPLNEHLILYWPHAKFMGSNKSM
jgi:hypothetical protein